MIHIELKNKHWNRLQYAHGSSLQDATFPYPAVHEPLPFHSHLPTIPQLYKMRKTEAGSLPVQIQSQKVLLHLACPYYSAPEYI